jgi:hypothetical protein
MNALAQNLLAEHYGGHPWSLVFLGVLGVMTLVPGLIHHFFRDGGAESIAGLRLGEQRELVIGVFAWLGATQIAWGLLILAVAGHYQMLAPLVLLLLVIERSLLVVRWWSPRRPPAHRPPEHYASLVLLPVAVGFFVLALPAAVAPIA